MLTKEVPTIAIVPEEMLSLSQKVEKWVYQLCESLEQNYQQSYPNSYHRKEFTMELGRKYWKIKEYDVRDGKRYGGGVHAFIDRNTGEVYKPASYKSPAKHVRYDMRIINNRERLHNPNYTDWAGSYLYLRG